MEKQSGGGAIRPLVTLATLVAAAIAYLPAEIILRAWVAWPGMLVVLISIGVFVAFSLVDSEGLAKKTVRSRVPFRTIPTAIAAAVTFAALASMLLLAVFAIVYLIVKLINMRWDVPWIVAVLTIVISVIGTIILSLAGGGRTREGLYRSQPTELSPYEKFTPSWHSKGVIFFVVEIVFALALSLIWALVPRVAVGYAIAALIALLLTGLIAMGGVEFPDDAVQPAAESFRERFESVLRSLGYNVTLRPQVGDAPTDELLKLVDLIAEREGRVFTLRLCWATKDKREITWSSVADMIVTANALQRYMGEGNTAPVESAVILVDAAPDQALRQLAAGGQLRLIEVGSDADAAAISGALQAGLADQPGTVPESALARHLPNEDRPKIPWVQT
jgi:hypothetical protein